MEIPYAYTDTWTVSTSLYWIKDPHTQQAQKSGYMGIKEV